MRVHGDIRVGLACLGLAVLAACQTENSLDRFDENPVADRGRVVASARCCGTNQGGKSALQGLGKSVINGTPDSNVLRLRLGMSVDQVTRIVGAHQNEGFDASDGGTSCRSYEYDETIKRKFVHAYFYNNALTAASDGHADLCRFGGDTQ